MKRTSLLIGLVLVAYVLSVGFVVKNHIEQEKVRIALEEKRHSERFEEFMEHYGLEKSDAECEFGWNMTAIPFDASKYTDDEIYDFIGEVPQNIWNSYYAQFNED